MSEKKLLVISNLILGVVSLSAIGLAIYSMETSPRIAYVENDKLLKEYRGLKETHQKTRQKKERLKADLDTLEKEINTHIRNYRENKDEMSKEQRKSSEEFIKKKQKRYFKYKKAVEEKIGEENEKKAKEVLTQINGFLENYGEKRDYDMIIGVTGVGNVLYGEEGMDITDEVTEKLNSMYQGK